MTDITPTMRSAADIMPVSFLRECFEYNAETGALTWRERPREHFGSDGVWKSWNAKWSKKTVSCTSGEGYLQVGINSRRFQVHRIAWALSTGQWPIGDIDHINGEKSDNRLSNLRDVPHIENTKNQPIRKNNTSGVIGVAHDKASGKWRAEIMSDNRRIRLGLFCDINDAIAARKSAERRFGFHENHGRRACPLPLR